LSSTLTKSLSTVHLWAITVGMVISGMYFGWNYALQYTSPLGFILSMAIVTVFYLAFIFCFAEMATAIPHAGASSEFARRTMGSFGGYITGFSCIVEYLFAVPAIALGIGAYIHVLLPAIPAVVAATAFYVLFVVINLLQVTVAAKIELLVTVLAIAGLALFVVFGFFKFHPANFATSGVSLGGFKGIFATIPFAIWFYLGVEGGAVAAEECSEPKRQIPRAFLGGILALVAMALLTLVVTVGLSEPSKIANVDSPLPTALAIAFGENSLLSKLLSFVGLFGLIASLHGLIIGYSRQTYAMAREGYLPRFLANTSKKHNAPVAAVIVPSIIGLGFVLSQKTAAIITISCIGAVALYILSMVSYFLLRSREPKLERPYRVKGMLVPVLALLIALVFLVAVTWTNLSTMVWVLVAYAAAVLFYFGYSVRSMKRSAEDEAGELELVPELEA